MAKHLSYSLQAAFMECNETEHAQVVMERLGITYQHATVHPVADSWWFWNCENVPDPLPPYLFEKHWNPMEMIGWGLSEKDAIKIRDYKTNNNRNNV